MKTTDDRMAKVNARYGKTLGASKGGKPTPAPKVKVLPTKGGVKVTVKKKF